MEQQLHENNLRLLLHARAVEALQSVYACIPPAKCVQVVEANKSPYRLGDDAGGGGGNGGGGGGGGGGGSYNICKPNHILPQSLAQKVETK